jgi:hypothetical protein
MQGTVKLAQYMLHRTGSIERFYIQSLIIWWFNE